MQPTIDPDAPQRSDAIARLLARGGLIDNTTTGRRSGRPRRIEIVFHNIDGRIVITGMPRSDRKRAWLYNLEADPRLTVHLKGTLEADLPGTARVITDPAERRLIADWVVRNAWRRSDADAMAAYSPMIEVSLD
jgi:deazaflavin-dependent oxidoreductase (nitroreductase family)